MSPKYVYSDFCRYNVAARTQPPTVTYTAIRYKRPLAVSNVNVRFSGPSLLIISWIIYFALTKGQAIKNKVVADVVYNACARTKALLVLITGNLSASIHTIMLSRCNLSLLHCRLRVQYVHTTQYSRHGSIRYLPIRTIIIVVVDEIKSIRAIDDARNDRGISPSMPHYHRPCEFSSCDFRVFKKLSGFLILFVLNVKSLNGNNKKKKNKTNNSVRNITVRMENSFCNGWNLSFERQTIAISPYAACTYCM